MQYLGQRAGPALLCSEKFPEDGTQVSKHVGV